MEKNDGLYCNGFGVESESLRKSHCHTDLTFEIIEIGAVRVSDDRKTIVDSFQQVIKPRVFKKLHYKIQEITHFTEEELNDGKDFRKVIRDFLEWCGDDYIFCTWGSMDLTELQKNMKHYNLKEYWIFRYSMLIYRKCSA